MSGFETKNDPRIPPFAIAAVLSTLLIIMGFMVVFSELVMRIGASVVIGDVSDGVGFGTKVNLLGLPAVGVLASVFGLKFPSFGWFGAAALGFGTVVAFIGGAASLFYIATFAVTTIALVYALLNSKKRII